MNEIPDNQYELILADPPWRYTPAVKNRQVENHYPTMKLEDIKNLHIPTAKNAVLYLWATGSKIVAALEVMKAWGFTYKSQAIWDKEIIGMGYWWRGQHELLLVGTKGKFSPPPQHARVSSVFRERRRKHSQKPDIVYKLIEAFFPDTKKIELFARNTREGWDSWGNEVSNSIAEQENQHIDTLPSFL